MQFIEKLSNMIEEELCDAEKYIQCAMDKKADYPDLANVFYKLSTEEINHVNLLHDQVVALIAKFKSENGEPPEKMQWLYDYMHKKHIEKANQIKIMQAIYKG